LRFIDHFRRLTPVQRNTFIACFLGWSLDAFDFFILVFCVSALAAQFHMKTSAILEANFLTLAMRPVGAFLFGMVADKFGRRPALMIDIIAFSVFELGSAFAPSFKVFLIMRVLFGIAMGGEWGVGAALTFETLPAEGRGIFSGVLQEGYAAGYLMAALVYASVFRFVGWRGMFVIGALPAFLVIYIRSKVHESPAWVQGHVSQKSESHLWRDISANLGIFLFLVVLMFSFNSFSHGTQDLYPTFLQKDHKFLPQTVGFIAVIANIGALLGGIVFGAWSEKIGRRRAIIVAALLSIPAIPLWAYSHSIAMLALGGFVMQFMVQGAWGVIPAHLAELSPDSVRGLLPGFAYQSAGIIASTVVYIEAAYAQKTSYATAMALTAISVFILASVMAAVGRERRGQSFGNQH
jgi:MFS transporter, SHS family, lactate transporter